MKLKFIQLITILFLVFNSYADECKNRGDLDILYCDENYDLVADSPKDKKLLKDPKNLVFAFSLSEDNSIQAEVFGDFIKYLNSCLDKKVSLFQLQSNSSQVEAMRSGRLHLGSFATGPVIYGVNLAGAVPFATNGYNDGSFEGYYLIVIVKKDSNFQKLTDLKDKKVAHTTSSSNSGHMAPLALLPKEGLIPDKDYKILFAGKHDQAILGVNSGDYDGATVSSDIFYHMIRRNQIKEEDFRILYQSPEKFPTAAYSFAHDLNPKLQEKIKKCFFNYRFSDEMSEQLNGTHKFSSITYKKDWAIIREIAKEQN